jgi:RNA polymerase sigma factor (TIGR02999 family)
VLDNSPQDETPTPGDSQGPPRAIASADLIHGVYAQLRQLAAARLTTLPPGQTLQPTALVHEAYLKLTAQGDPGWESQGHFFGAAAIAMRYVLLDHARARLALKRGGGGVRLDLDESKTPGLSFDSASEDIVALDELLTLLEKHHARPAQVLMMKFFGGLSDEQIAEALSVSSRTVTRDGRFAKAWLMARWRGGAFDSRIGDDQIPPAEPREDA